MANTVFITTTNVADILDAFAEDDITNQKKLEAIINICNIFIHLNNSIEDVMISSLINTIKRTCEKASENNATDCLKKISNNLSPMCNTESYVGKICLAINVIANYK